MALLSCLSWIPLLWRSLNHRNGNSSFEHLPDDVVIDILSRLPAVCVGRSRIVCKRWQRLMSTTSFAELHLEKAKRVILLKHERGSLHIEEELKSKNRYQCVTRRNEILGGWLPRCSCNGLLLLWRNSRAICIWNPITGETVSLWLPEQRRFVSAFFFHPMRREYVVLFYAIHLQHAWFEILSLRTRSWRRLSGVAYAFPYSFTPPDVVCGSMHWVLDKKEEKRSGSELIMRLNLESEVFDVMPHPDEESFSGEESCYLVEMEKRLSLCSVYGDSFNVWILMDYEKWDWVKKYRISLKSDKPYDSNLGMKVIEGGCCWLGDIKIINGDLLLHWYGNGLYSCNLQTSKLRRIVVEGIDEKYRDLFEPSVDTPVYLLGLKCSSVFELHVNSIISLQNLYGYKGDVNFLPRATPLPTEERFLDSFERLLCMGIDSTFNGLGRLFMGLDRVQHRIKRLIDRSVWEETSTIIVF